MLDLSVGDSDTPYLDVAPYDGTTVVTLTVHSPADVSPTGTAVTVDSGVEMPVDGVQVKRFTAAPVQYTAASWWVHSWKVVGTGAYEPENRFFVAPNPTAGGPEWTPTRERVAAYVPGRPLVPQADGSNRDVMTFDSTTRPTGAQVDQLIADAVDWVLAATGTLHTTLYTSATACAAMRAAGLVELGYPERHDPMRETANNTAKILLGQADSMLKQLVARNTHLTGEDPDGDGGSVTVLPVWSFPEPAAYGDYTL